MSLQWMAKSVHARTAPDCPARRPCATPYTASTDWPLLSARPTPPPRPPAPPPPAPPRDPAHRFARLHRLADLRVQPVEPGQHEVKAGAAIDDHQQAKTAERPGEHHPAAARRHDPGIWRSLVGDAAGRSGLGAGAE